jgi:hypothetical protein
MMITHALLPGGKDSSRAAGATASASPRFFE